MTNSGTIQEQVRDYAASVAEHLVDLPSEVRADLVADLEQHLIEVAAESDVALTEALGTPEAYAAELRVSAGLETVGPAHQARGIRDAVQHLLAGLRAHPQWASTAELAHDLRPAWWVARGLAPGTVVAVFGHQTSRGLGWFLTGLIGVVVSVRVGRRGVRRADARTLVNAVNIVAGVALLWAAVYFIQYGFPTRYETIVEEASPQHLVHPGGEPITNIYAFDATGTPVDGIFLYDGAGRPLEVKRSAGEMFGIQTDFQRSIDGAAVRNLFPLQQYVREPNEQGDRMLQPRARPQVQIPSLSPVPDGEATPSASETPTHAPSEAPAGQTTEAPTEPRGDEGRNDGPDEPRAPQGP